ncbi:MAG TPA: hypothetical protein VL359_04430, partial [bacterium]|nr:hypothetical protein [bacterium]
MFDLADLVYAYTAQQAYDDGLYVSLNGPGLADVAGQHFKCRCFCTVGLWAVIEQEAQTGTGDRRGILHDLLFLAANEATLRNTGRT